jgi:hypothetical protein
MRTATLTFLACLLMVLGGAAHADVTSSSNPALVMQPVTFTVEIEVPSGVTATPTGMVTFMDNGASIGTAQVHNGAASLTAQFSVIGDHTIVAAYSGDPNFQAANSAPFVEHVSDDDIFTVSVAPTIIAQSAGQTSNAQVSLFGSGRTADARLSCEGLPPGVQCQFSPGVVLPSTGGASSAVAITSTNSRTAALPTGIAILALTCLMLPCSAGKRNLALVILGLILWIPLSGCGGGTKTVEVTPSGSYSIHVVADDGQVTQTATIKFTVN